MRRAHHHLLGIDIPFVELEPGAHRGSDANDMTTEAESSQPAVSCVIAAFHRPDSLTRLLALLAHPAIEVIVVNIGDDPEIATLAGLRAVGLPGNPGYAVAVNLGVRAANSPVIVFMNDDLEIDAESVLELAAPVREGWADVNLPCVVDADGRREPTITALVTPANLLKEWLLLPDHPNLLGRWFRGIQKWRAPSHAERIDAGAATVVATKTKLLLDEPLPEQYFLYFEESEWFWRLQRRGSRVMYDPEVCARHTGGRDDVRPVKSRLLARNAVRCVRRTQGRGSASIAWPIVVLWNLRLVIVDQIRSWGGSEAAAGRMSARLQGLRAAVVAWKEIR